MAAIFNIVIYLASISFAHNLYPHQIINNLRPSQLWVQPYLSENDRKSHPFFSSFDEEHGFGADLLSNCTVNYFTQPLDHYNYRKASNAQSTYEQRYFICGGKNWKANNTIFFYTGNEANVELCMDFYIPFYNNIFEYVIDVNATGLMWENADTFNAIMVFAEHRYFGKSLPFGTDESDLKSENIIFLSADQAMADYANLINALKTEWNSWSSPLIGFGGSYGGMLCTWFKTKYPQWIDGCISASAPITSFIGEHPKVNYNFFADGETYDCKKEGGNPNDYCAENFEKSWNVIFDYANSEQGRQQLKDAFNLCSVPKDYAQGANVAYWVSNGLGFMTMGSYPYASSYMLNGDGILPAYPMRLGCSYLTSEVINDEMTLLEGARKAVGVFYNYTGEVECFDLDASANNATQIDGILWNYLYCTEIFQTFGQNGDKVEPTDMFWYAPWNATEAAEGCFADYGVETRQLWAEVNYGGWRPFTSGSVGNIVFSNGELDPWRGGGVQGLNDTENDIYSIIVPDSGHHIDLFFSNANDTDAIRNVRQFELDMISKWIKMKQSTEW